MLSCRQPHRRCDWLERLPPLPLAATSRFPCRLLLSLAGHCYRPPVGLSDLIHTTTYCVRIQCCGAGILIPDPDFYLFRIRTPDAEEKKLVVLFNTSLTRNLQIPVRKSGRNRNFLPFRMRISNFWPGRIRMQNLLTGSGISVPVSGLEIGANLLQ